MSFGTGGFGFGQANQPQQQSTGFGGFGTNTNTTSAFGQATPSAFGTPANNTTGGGLFGGGGTSGGFGSTGGGGFGSTNTGGFGAKPAFGAATTTAGGLFGSSTTTTAGPSAFGGFGSNTNTANTGSSAFGGGSSLFGASKPTTGFGSGTTGATTGTSLFGSGANTGGGGFGSAAGGGFGASNNPGIGTNVGDPPGTNVVTFQPTIEKEANSATQQNSFQNVLFMEPYKKFSAEELRLADYTQGRRYGNASGGGAFGVNSSFGSGGFGANNNTATGFGATATTSTTTGGLSSGLFGGTATGQQATSGTGGFIQAGSTTGGFGSTGGGLFGAAKPATTGLFGSTAASQPAQTGGLFGGAATGGGGFGSAGTTGSAFGSSTTGGGLFGSSNPAAATASKPPGFSFGTGAATGTTGGFGSAATTGAFGNGAATTGGGLFGNNAQQQPQQQQQTGGLFGQQQQPANTGSAFGGGGFGQQAQQGTSSLFGAATQKPGGGLFGGAAPATTTTGGGLFGSAPANTATPFGGNQTNQAGGGLFGAKPAGSGGLFGGSTTAQPAATGGGLFGGSLGSNIQAQQQQPAQAGGLFGGLGQGAQAKPSMFGTTQGTGGGLFGAQNQQPQQGSLFGSTQQQPIQGGSLFGASQNQSAPQSLTTSLADMSAFGTGSLFAGVGGNDVQNPGPLATPLSSAKKQPARASILPIYKLSKPQTPKRGFGFSYSTYGSPSTPSSANSTPGGFGQSILAGSLGRSLNKSISTSNLRRSFNAEDSILAPGAFSASTGPKSYGNNGSIKRLVINRDIRSELFSTPNKDRSTPEVGSARKTKRVSFDTSTAATIEDGTHSPPDDSASSSSRAQDLGYLRPATRGTNGVNGSSRSVASDGTPEMEQVKGNELAIVHEEGSPHSASRSVDNGSDAEAGDYWMHPSKEEIHNMNRMQRQNVTDFTVGRKNIGNVRFRVPVDLSNIDIDEIFEGLVVLHPRSCTVYPNPAKKPAMGKGLNVPAEITLEQSWPRGRDKAGSRGLSKHVERLKRIPDTGFVSYNPETGVWVFTVEHFTTYGLDDDDDDEETELDAAAPQQPLAPKPILAQPQHSDSRPYDAHYDESLENRRARRIVPGAFDPAAEAMDEEETPEYRGNVRPPSPNESSESERGDHATDIAQELSDLDMGVEGEEDSPDILATQDRLQHSLHLTPAVQPPGVPASIVRARMRAIKESTAPERFEVTGGDDWMHILKKSVNAGRPRDRAALHSLNEAPVNSIGGSRNKEKPSNRRTETDGRGFATSIDLMNSLFGKDKSAVASEEGPASGMDAFNRPAKPFIKWPYQKQHQRDSTDATKMNPRERQFHLSFKPRWGPGNALLVVKPRGSFQGPDRGGVGQAGTGIATRSQELWKIQAFPLPSATTYWSIQESGIDQAPSQPSLGALPAGPPESGAVRSFSDVVMAGKAVSQSSPVKVYEQSVWELASILFDPIAQGSDEKRIRRQKLSAFWRNLVFPKTSRAIDNAWSADRKAVACLTGHQVIEASRYLKDAKHYKLATLVPLIGTSDWAKKDMAEQLQDWQHGDVLAEMETTVRIIYCLLASEVTVCKGKTGAGSENRLETIVLSEHLGLNWQQSFGLRLWYGISSDDDIAAAVAEYEHDMEQGLTPRPVPWYQEGAAYSDKENATAAQDIMWGLLKLYSGRASLEEVLQPENWHPSPLDYSLCWQLAHLLSDSGKEPLPHQSQSTVDSLALSYTAQLTSDRSWLPVVQLSARDRGDMQAYEVTSFIHDLDCRAKLLDKASVEDAARRVLVYRNMAKAWELPFLAVKQGRVRHEADAKESRRDAAGYALVHRYLGSQVNCLDPINIQIPTAELVYLKYAGQHHEMEKVVVRKLDALKILVSPPAQDLPGFIKWMRNRPVKDGLSEVAALAERVAKGERLSHFDTPFDYDGYLGMLKKKREEADEKDVLMLAAISTLSKWVEAQRLAGY
ncbi:hypothetical protein RB600_007749 [Gaeumannomyces tritici]